VFGLYKWQENVYAEIIPDCSRAAWQGIVRGRVSPDPVVHSGGWRGYNGLVDVGCEKYFGVDHCLNEFVRGASHINGLKAFGAFQNFD